MKIKFKNTPEQHELIKAMVSPDPAIAQEARMAFAAFVTPVALAALQQASTVAAIFEDLTFDEDTDPSIPLDLYSGQKDGYLTVWSQNEAGGLPSNYVSGLKELKLSTYILESAINFQKKYIRRSRLDVVARGIQQLTQEILVKQERNAWAVLLAVAAQASSNVAGVTKNHAFRSSTAGVLQLEDFNKLLTLGKRISASFADGTADPNSAFGVTDLYISPESKEQIRGFAYQPMNTRVGTAGSPATSTAVPLPDSVREEIYRNAGGGEIYGITLHEMNEFGEGQKYNKLFQISSAGKTYYQADGSSGGATFNAASDDLLVGLDLTKDAFIRPVNTNDAQDATGQFILRPDNQWVDRSEKIGFYGKLEEGRAVIDNRAVFGLIV